MPVTTTNYTDSTVTNGTTYFYFVKAVNASGSSTASNEVSATPNQAAPPTNLAATPGDTQIVLNWTASASATGYNVYRGTSRGGESSTPVNGSPIVGTTYNDMGLTNGTTYWYYVKAITSSGLSLASNEVSATPSAATPPVPTGLMAAAGVNQVVLNWMGSLGAASYNVYRGTSSGGESGTAIATGITATTYTDTAVTPGTTYFYYVKAVNGAGGISAPSNEASATPTGAIPAAPTSLAASASDSLVTLFWIASPGATSYNVYRGTSPGGESNVPLSITPVSIPFTNLLYCARHRRDQRHDLLLHRQGGQQLWHKPGFQRGIGDADGFGSAGADGPDGRGRRQSGSPELDRLGRRCELQRLPRHLQRRRIQHPHRHCHHQHHLHGHRADRRHHLLLLRQGGQRFWNRQRALQRGVGHSDRSGPRSTWRPHRGRRQRPGLPVLDRLTRCHRLQRVPRHQPRRRIECAAQHHPRFHSFHQCGCGTRYRRDQRYHVLLHRDGR